MSSVLEIVVMGEDRASGVLRGIGGALNSFGDSARRVGMDLLPISAGAALVAGGAIKMAADYERSMDVLQASTGASTLEMQALDKMAVALGGDMTLPATSAKDAADAMLELSKAGLSVKDTMTAARGVLQLSAAAQISNAEAALITGNALNMFKLSGDKATAVADLLAAGANKSSANIQQMADALQMSGNVAASAGLTIGDLTTAIALMANQGIAGSDAGTSIKTMLLSLEAPTKKSQKLMDALGISIYDAQGKMLPMPGLIAEFSGALGGLSQQQQNAALKTIFGSDAIRAANVLLLGGTQAWNDMSTAVNAGGAAAEMAAAQNKGLSGALDGLRSVVETVLLTAARPLLDTLSGIVRWVADLIGKFAEANPQLMTAGLAFAGVLAVAAPLALGIGLISTALGALLSPVGLVIGAVGALAAAWVTDFGGIQTTITTWWAGVQPKLAAAADAIKTGIGQAIVDVRGWWDTNFPAMQAAVTTWWTNTQPKLTEAAGAIKTGIGQAIVDVRSWWDTNFPAMQTAVTTWWTNTQPKLVEAASAIKTGIGQAIVDVRGWWETNFPAMLTAVATWWTGVQPKLTEAASAIRDKVGQAVKDVSGWFATEWPKMQKWVQVWWDDVKNKFELAASAIKDKVGQAVKDVSGWFAVEWPKMLAAVATWWSGVQPKLKEAADAIRDKVGQAVKDLASTFETEWPKMKAAVVTWHDNVKPKLDAIIKVVKDFNTALGDLYKKFSPIDDAAKSLKKNLDPILEVIGKIIKVVKDINTLFKTMTDVVVALKDKVVEYTKWALTPLAAGLLAIIQPIKDIIQGIQGKIDKMNAAGEPMNIFTKALNAISGALDAISGAVATAIGWLKKLADAIRSLPKPPDWITPGSPTPFELGLRGITDALGPVITNLNSLSAAVGGIPALDAAKNIATGLASIADAAVKTAEAMLAFKPVNNLGVITSQIMDFLLGVETQFAALVQEVDQALANKAKEFADALAPVMSLISSAMETLNGLVTMLPQPDWPGIQSKIVLIVAFIGKVAGELGVVSLAVGSILQDAAQEFVEKLGGASEIIASATEAMNGLATMMPQPDWPGMQAKIMEIVAFIGKVAGELGVASLAVGNELQDAAKKFAENVGPVIDIITGGLEAITALREFQGLDAEARETIIVNMQALDRFLASLVGDLAKVASVAKEELQTAARIFAENVGPAIDIIVGGLEAIAALRDFKRLDAAAREAIIVNMQALNRFLASLVADLAKVAGVVQVDLQTAARIFADNVGAAIDIIMGGLEALTALREFKKLDAAAREAIIVNMMALDRFLASLVADLAKVAGVVGTEMQGAAKLFAENVAVVLDALTAAFDTLKSIGELQAPAVGLAWVTNLVTSMTAAVPSLDTILAQIVAAFHTAAADLQTGAYNAGLAFMTSLADGLTAGLLSVEAALAAVADLFPHSPAKAGPLKVTPDWSAWMMGGLGDAAGMVSSALAWQMPRGLLAGGMGQSGGTTSNSTTVNINGPTIRDEMDIRRLADAVSMVLTNQQSTNRRLGATW